MKTFALIIVILSIVWISYTKMSDGVDTQTTEIKKKVMRLAYTESVSESVTVNVGETGYLLKNQVMISVLEIVINKAVGNGAGFKVELPDTSFTAKVKAGKRMRVMISGEKYFLVLKSVSAESAKFQIVKGDVQNDQS
jgi:hypothetical protein